MLGGYPIHFASGIGLMQRLKHGPPKKSNKFVIEVPQTVQRALKVDNKTVTDLGMRSYIP